MLSKKEMIISLVGNAVFSIPLPDDFPKELTSEAASQLLRSAKEQDLAHLVAFSLKNNKISVPIEIETGFQKQLLASVYRTERFRHELKGLARVFQDAKIPYIPLKGSVLRAYYPEPWMRTSSDIDLLVQEEYLDRAGRAITEEATYTARGRWKGERSYFSPGGIHLELHFYDEEDDEEGAAFRDIWNYAKPVEENAFCMQVEWEFFYLHHVLHMAKHFSHGGCGIRPFLDLALMKEKISMDSEKKSEYLSSFGLSDFADAAERLSSVWFGNGEHTEVTARMEKYLLGAGIFGSIQNQIAVEKSGKSKRMKGFLSHIWLPFDVIKLQYPILMQRKWLLPFFQMRRWFKLVFCGGLKRSLRHIRENQKISDEKVKSVARLLDDLKLS